MSEHAILAPSSAARWVACPGSVAMSMLYPEPETPESREGTAAHWVAYELFNEDTPEIGEIAPNGEVVTEEMVEGAILYCDAIRPALSLCPVGTRAHIEERVDISYINAHNWGTPDLWFFNETSAELWIYDYKFGHGYVDAFENWQLIDYAAGILAELDVCGLYDQAIRVHITVVQPRSYHKDGPVRTWSIVASELRPYFNIITNQAAVALSNNPPCIPNDECEFCPGRHACNALQIEAYKAIKHSGRSVPVELSNDALALEAFILNRAKKRLDARLTGLEQQIESRIRGGQIVSGYAVEPSYGRETWAVPTAEVLALGNLFSVPVAKNDVITPNQAIKAGLDKSIVAQYTKRPSNGLKLIVDDGKLARKVFAK